MFTLVRQTKGSYGCLRDGQHQRCAAVLEHVSLSATWLGKVPSAKHMQVHILQIIDTW